MIRPVCFRQDKNLSENLRQALRSLSRDSHHVADVADVKFCLPSGLFFDGRNAIGRMGSFCFIRFATPSSDLPEWRGSPGRNKQEAPQSRASNLHRRAPTDPWDLLDTRCWSRRALQRVKEGDRYPQPEPFASHLVA